MRISYWSSDVCSSDLFVGLPHEEPKWEYLTDADWAGIAGLILGLGALTVLLEEGHREDWFESALIRWLALIAVIGFASLIYGQLNASKPVLKLRLLLNRQFGRSEEHTSESHH